MIKLLDFIVSLAEWLFKSSLKASILIVLILIIQFLFRRKMAARWQYGLWFLLIIRLILPFEIESQFSLFNLIPSMDMASLETQRSSEISPTSEIQIPTFDLLRTPSIPITTDPKISQNFRITTGQILALIWLVGVLGFGIYIFGSNFKLRRKIHRLKPSSNQTMFQLLEQCKTNMKISRNILLIEMDGIRIPVLFGILKPKILLPQNFIAQMTRDQIKHIFLHEFVHYKRKDVLVSFVTKLLQILYWFNPISWFAFYRIRIDINANWFSAIPILWTNHYFLIGEYRSRTPLACCCWHC